MRLHPRVKPYLPVIVVLAVLGCEVSVAVWRTLPAGAAIVFGAGTGLPLGVPGVDIIVQEDEPAVGFTVSGQSKSDWICTVMQTGIQT